MKTVSRKGPGGSSPSPSAIINFGDVAQSGEHWPVKSEVARSKLVIPAIFILEINMKKIKIKQQYIVYKITNLVNGKVYIGVHKTKIIKDDS